MPIEPPPPLDQNAPARPPQPTQAAPPTPAQPLTDEEMQQVLAIISEVETKETGRS